jgi:tyrosine-protein kinase Etk/Wzc
MHFPNAKRPEEAVQSPPNSSADVEGIDLLDISLSLLLSKLNIAICTALFGLLGLGISLLLKPVFTATAVIMPPQQEQSSANALMGQLGALGSLGGGAASSLGLKNPADLYVGILRSRIIADSLIDRFHLQQEYHQMLRMGARDVLRANSDFEAASDGLIYIRVKDHDPKMAAVLANAYVDELHSMNSRLAIGQAAQRRLFYDQQLATESKDLRAAEEDLKRTEEHTGLIQLSGQAEMTIRNIADARAQIASREVQLSGARAYEADQNPDVIQLEAEIVALKSHLAQLEDAQQRMAPGDTQIPGAQVAGAGLEYTRKLREVKYHEAFFELLAKQREAAGIDEAKSAPIIQVVDPAEAPERKSGPSRTLITIGFGLLGFVLSSSWAILSFILSEMRRSPGQSARIDELQRAFKVR